MPEQQEQLRAVRGGAYTARSTGRERTFGAGDLVDPAELDAAAGWLVDQGVLVAGDAPAPRDLAALGDDTVLVAAAYQGRDARAVSDRQAAEHQQAVEADAEAEPAEGGDG